MYPPLEILKQECYNIGLPVFEGIVCMLQALLRKKIQEYRRLDIEHQNEKHLRQELEYDLEQCGQKIVEKGKILLDHIYCISLDR